jgi:hypothetical protein
MEKKLNLKAELYFTQFKDTIRQKAIDINFGELDKINELLETVYEYERLVFTKEDLSKRKRVKNTIPMENRCIAKRANNEQCTRKRKPDNEYCGTHCKSIQYNDTVDNDTCLPCTKPIDVVARSISGVVYYIDKFLNVYNTSDILEGKLNPSIIAKAKTVNGVFSIPAFGLGV